MSNLKIGFAGTFYTLWSVSTWPNYVTDPNGRSYLAGYTSSFCYYQNLSKDIAKAREKAKAKGCKDLTPDPELYGRRTSWERYQKSEEQKELDREAAAEAAKAEAKAAAEAAARYEAFIDSFLEGRPFVFVSNFKVHAYSGGFEISANVDFEPRDKYEEDLVARNIYGTQIPFKFLKLGDLVEKYYNGYIYYTLSGFRSMKGKEARVINSKLIF